MDAKQEIKRVMFAAGGSAGHINPALAIADKVKEIFPDCEILFTGTQKGLESKLVARAGYAFKPIKVAGFQRKLTPRNAARNAKAAYYFMTAGAVSKKMITEFAPDIVVGTGGYVTAPVLRAAAKLGVKTVAHESNSLPGLATKMLVGVADKVLVSNADTLKHFDSVNHPSNAGKFVVTGNPLRGEFRKQERRGSALESLKLTGGMTILSFGGSLGANAISRGVIDLIKWGRDKSVNHIHAYGGNGKGLFEKLLKDNDIPPEGERYIFAEYIHNMYTCIAAADIVICRSGSMSQTELKAFGRASIQIPWSGAAENHQYYNALTMHKAGAAILIEDRELSGAKLVEVVEQLYNDRLRIRLMEENAARMSSPNAAGLIVSEMMDLTSNS